MTIYEIADIAKVSTATVSRVLNDKPGVRQEVRDRVEKIIEENDFRPNLLARGLSNNKTDVIGVILPGINSYFTERVDAINKICHENGYSTMIAANYKHKNNVEEDIDNINLMLNKQVDGIIYCASRLSKTHLNLFNKISKKIPIISTDNEIKGSDIPAILQDNNTGTIMMMKYLIKNGHKKIGFMKGTYYDDASKERFETYKEEMKKNNLNIDKKFIWEGFFSLKEAYSSFSNFLEKSDDYPTAVFAANDIMAIGIIKAINEKGLRVPEDISVVGFDNIEMAKYSNPGLTSIDIDQNAVGEHAAKMMIDMIEKKKISMKKVIMNQELIIRESVLKI